MLRCAVYATPFAAAVLRRKLAEVQLVQQVPLHVVAPGGAITLPPFSLRLIRVAHSIPEAQALAISTPAGLVLHTGDWKYDPEPLIGPPTDEAAFAELGQHGVLAMVCDSTNAMVEGHSGSEAEVRRTMSALIRGLSGRVAVTCFASNVARIESVALAARDAGRSVAIAGRSLRNLEAAARECGYLSGIAPFLSEDEASDVPDEHLLILVAGSMVYCVLTVIAARRYLAVRPAKPREFPPISILKPLAGVDEGLTDNLRTFFEQEYPEFEILFAVRASDDAAVAVVEAPLASFLTSTVALGIALPA